MGKRVDFLEVRRTKAAVAHGEVVKSFEELCDFVQKERDANTTIFLKFGNSFDSMSRRIAATHQGLQGHKHLVDRRLEEQSNLLHNLVEDLAPQLLVPDLPLREEE